MNKKRYSRPVSDILKDLPIVEYLEQRDIYPDKERNGEAFYCCFFPDHEDNIPSLKVDTNKNPNLFYCFGCQRGGSLIDLIVFLDGLTVGQAIRSLGGDSSENYRSALNTSFENMQKICRQGYFDPRQDAEDAIQEPVANMLYDISNKAKNFLKGVDNNPQAVSIIKEFYRILDQMIINKNYQDIYELRDILGENLNEYIERYKNAMSKSQ